MARKKKTDRTAKNGAPAPERVVEAIAAPIPPERLREMVDAVQSRYAEPVDVVVEQRVGGTVLPVVVEPHVPVPAGAEIPPTPFANLTPLPDVGTLPRGEQLDAFAAGCCDEVPEFAIGEPAKRERVAVVQTCRHGDIVNVLPLVRLLSETADVTVVVARAFAPILDAVGYCKVRVWDGPHNAPHQAAADVAADFDRVIVAQVNGNPALVPDCRPDNFIVENWLRFGGRAALDKFHDLPLIFDRRDRDAEMAAWHDVAGETALIDRPFLLYHLGGYSSPFQAVHGVEDSAGALFEQWLRNKFGRAYHLLDLADLKLDNPAHLLAFLERAAVLVTTDSLPLHLAYATGTPTIALSRNHPYYMSEPREHWIYRTTYDRANTPEVRQAIYDLLMPPGGTRYLGGDLCRPPAGMVRDRIVQAVDWYTAKVGSDERRRNAHARRSWERLKFGDPGRLDAPVDGRIVQKQEWELAYHEVQPGTRTAADLGDARRLPYVNDVVDYAAELADDDEILVLTNADTCVEPDAPAVIRAKLATGATCYGRRVDVADGTHPYTRAELALYPPHPGADLFAFRAGWWRAHRHHFPDLIVGCEGWDWVWRRIMEQHNRDAEIAAPAIIFHERHSPTWAYAANADSPGQLHNRRLCEEWARVHGYEAALFTPAEGQRCLFRLDEAWRK